MWRKIVGIGICILAFGASFSFQNCARQLESSSWNSIESSSTSKSVEDLTLDVVTDPHPETPNYKDQIEVEPLTTNRILTSRILLSVFGPSLENFLAYNIAWKPEDFGSGFSIYETKLSASANCDNKRLIEYPCQNIYLEVNVPNTQALNARREAWRAHICYFAVAYNPMILHAVQQVSSQATLANLPEVNSENLSKAFRLFYRSQPIESGPILDSLQIVSQDEQTELNKWKSILLTLCLSPHWQVL